MIHSFKRPKKIYDQENFYFFKDFYKKIEGSTYYLIYDRIRISDHGIGFREEATFDTLPTLQEEENIESYFFRELKSIFD